MWFARGHIIIKWQKLSHNPSHCLKAFNPFCSLFKCIFTLLNYIVFISSLTQGQHLSRTSGFNILSTNSSKSACLKGFCQRLTLQTASREGKGKTVQIWKCHFSVIREEKLVLFVQNESFTAKIDQWSSLFLYLSTSGFQGPERRRTQSLRSYIYVTALIRHQQSGEDFLEPEHTRVAKGTPVFWWEGGKRGNAWIQK